MSDTGRWVLVVEDHPLLARSIARGLSSVCEPKTAETVATGLEWLGVEADWAAAIVDVGLPDGNGFEVVRRARELFPILPVLVLTGRDDITTINEAHRLRAGLACKPFDLAEIVQFVKEALSFGDVSEQRILALVERLAGECKLTPREVQIVTLTLSQRSRTDLLTELGISENTLKTQVKSVLRKTGYDSITAMSRALLRELLESK